MNWLAARVGVSSKEGQHIEGSLWSLLLTGWFSATAVLVRGP